ncbi:response regulator [Rossellomorea marisflavi]|uniref:Transcriptional regulator n=1 Tax=Rossellomorea marisflavi TaxID=189381 RepID=A0A163LQS0_9BACI|nr:response regulator [Rossellomorea marisflavi]KMK94806.1 transcriptional regulator [Rossellomorea marisflavi]KZE50696.1 transcriptional regulator [Rossellomorea marisflavi]QHA35476.1 response regulator [Rossellomorea marisflavi]TYO71304.1 response regulator [Rossellomorea marisflavi]
MIKVIIAEDDFRVASIHERFLQKIEGVTVAGKALNGEETLRLLGEEEADLLLLDIYMQDQLGTDLLPAIRTRFPHVDVIMITAANDRELVATALRNGVLDYIIKPVSLKRFTSTLQQYQKRREMLKEKEEVSQATIDRLLGLHQTPLNGSGMPKGIDPLTLSKVKAIVEDTGKGISAEEMGSRMGASRATARRYLEYMVSTGEGTAELEYGIVGRPERKYFMAK